MDFFATLKSIIDLLESNIVIDKLTDILHAIGVVLYKGVHIYIKHYFLHAPRNAFGYEGAEYYDICKDITSVSSLHWIDNRELCEKTIDKHIGSYTTAFLLIVTPYIIFCCLTSKDLRDGCKYIFETMYGVKSNKRIRKNVDKEQARRSLTESYKTIAENYINLLRNIHLYNSFASLKQEMKEQYIYVYSSLPEDNTYFQKRSFVGNEKTLLYFDITNDKLVNYKNG